MARELSLVKIDQSKANPIHGFGVSTSSSYSLYGFEPTWKPGPLRVFSGLVFTSYYIVLSTDKETHTAWFPKVGPSLVRLQFFFLGQHPGILIWSSFVYQFCSPHVSPADREIIYHLFFVDIVPLGLVERFSGTCVNMDTPYRFVSTQDSIT